jgi:hypothetical protein
VEYDESGARHRIETERLTIRFADTDDAADLITYDRRNAAHLAPWEPRRNPVLAYDLEWRRTTLAQRRAEAEADRGYSYLARMRAEEAPVRWPRTPARSSRA